jgi:hypothetical protein
MFDGILSRMKESAVNSEKHKRPYFPPELTEVTPEHAKKILKDRANCSDSEAKEIVESLRREQYQKAG